MAAIARLGPPHEMDQTTECQPHVRVVEEERRPAHRDGDEPPTRGGRVTPVILTGGDLSPMELVVLLAVPVEVSGMVSQTRRQELELEELVVVLVKTK